MANTEKWKIRDPEYAKTVKNANAKTWVHIGAVMPFIKFGKPKVIKIALNKSCIINAKKCKPLISKLVSSANYVVLPNKGRLNYGFKFGEKLRIEVLNDSVDQMRVEGSAKREV